MSQVFATHGCGSVGETENSYLWGDMWRCTAIYASLLNVILVYFGSFGDWIC